MGRLRKEDKAGIYITVIFHLSVIIVLLAVQIGFSLQKENSFVLDFSKQEAIEKAEKDASRKEDISKKIDELLAAAEKGGYDIRNVAVDRSALKDDRGTDAEDLYKDAEKLQKDLKETFSRKEDEVFSSVEPEKKKEEKAERNETTYKGPSVVSYTLDGRKASKLPIPAYRCLGGGLVTVMIWVDNSGNVLDAKVEEAGSTQDQCLRDYAVHAAKMSRFSMSPSAPAKQVGNIVYQFIAQ